MSPKAKIQARRRRPFRSKRPKWSERSKYSKRKLVLLVSALVMLVVMLVVFVYLGWRGVAREGADAAGNTLPAAERSADRDARTDGGVGDAGHTGGSGAEQQSAPEGVRVAADSCPIELPDCRDLRYVKRNYSESWETMSDMACGDFATDVLLAMQADSFSLVGSGYLDLFGEAWGCTVKSPEDAVYVVTMRPEQLGKDRGAGNRLNVSVMHIFEPEF